jgi:hypothetical protein
MVDYTVLLRQVNLKAKEWSSLLNYFEQKRVAAFSHVNGTLVEWKSIEALVEYAQSGKFDKEKSKPLLQDNLSKPFMKFHKEGNVDKENLSAFVRLCKEYLFTDRKVFEAFHNALCGKQNNEEREEQQEEYEEQAPPPPIPKYCRYCGKPYHNPTSNYCSNCGKKRN